jgi:hypothetical protein
MLLPQKFVFYLWGKAVGGTYSYTSNMSLPYLRNIAQQAQYQPLSLLSKKQYFNLLIIQELFRQQQLLVLSW